MKKTRNTKTGTSPRLSLISFVTTMHYLVEPKNLSDVSALSQLSFMGWSDRKRANFVSVIGISFLVGGYISVISICASCGTCVPSASFFRKMFSDNSVIRTRTSCRCGKNEILRTCHTRNRRTHCQRSTRILYTFILRYRRRIICRV